MVINLSYTHQYSLVWGTIPIGLGKLVDYPSKINVNKII